MIERFFDLPHGHLFNEGGLVPAHKPGARADLFHDLEDTARSVEVEYLDVLFALIRATKPLRILETGTYHGIATAVMARACMENGFGVVHTVERDPRALESAVQIWRHVLGASWSTHVVDHLMDSLVYCRADHVGPFDFALFDSDEPIKPLEFEALVEHGKLRGLAAFHDTGRHAAKADPVYLEAVASIKKRFGGIELPLSRGLTIVEVR